MDIPIGKQRNWYEVETQRIQCSLPNNQISNIRAAVKQGIKWQWKEYNASLPNN